MKKIFLLVMSALSAISIYAYDFAATNGDGITICYTITSNAAPLTVEVSRNPDGNYAGNIVIPESVDNSGITYSVTGIGSYAFSYCTGLTSVTIPNSVTEIGTGAFYYCSGLTSVTLGNGVIEIGTSAFSRCSSLTAFAVESGNASFSALDGVLFNNDQTTLIQYPLGKQNVSYTIPNTVTEISYGAFVRCTGLTSVTIPNSVTEIGNYAFSYCTGLTSVTIPNSVTEIGIYAFSDCTGLTAFAVETGNSSFSALDGVLFNNDKTTLIQYPAGKQNVSYTIPSTVTEIIYGAFARCTGLTSVTIPNSVTGIGSQAFYMCTGLTSVTIPNSVTEIGDFAFSYCTGLTSITNKSATPQTINPFSFSFYNVDVENCTLYVPSGSLSAYQNAEVWQDFNTIVETSTFTTPSNHYVIVEWVAVDNAAGYNIAVYSDAEHTQLVGSAYVPASNAQSASANSPLRSSTAGNILQYTIDGLSENTQYFFEIVAVDATNEPIVTFDGEFTTTQSTGIDAVLAGEIRIYPNPATDYIVIAGLTRNLLQNAQIYDISGRTVGALRAMPYNDGTATFNVSHLPSGVYFLKIGDKRVRFVKE